MENTLRIREITNNNTAAQYKNIDLGLGENLKRGTSDPSMVRIIKSPTVETITFLPDTPHNRAKFLQMSTVEIACYQDNQWVCIPKEWLELAFAPAVGAEEPAPSKVYPKEDPVSLDGIKGFEQIHKSKQKKAFQELLKADLPEGYKVEMLNAIIKSEHPNLAQTVKDLAEAELKELAKVS